MRTMTLLAALAVSALLAGPACADDEATRLTLSTRRVIVFKDGTCLVIKEGKAKAGKDGAVFTDEVPGNAILGSFWAAPTKGRLLSMTAARVVDRSDETRDLTCVSPLEVLLANVGKAATITLHEGKGPLDGTILRVLTRPTREEVSPVLAEQLGIALESEDEAAHPDRPKVSRELTRQVGRHCVLRAADGDHLIAIERIRSLHVKDMATELAHTLTTTTRTKRLSFRTDAKAGSEVTLNMMYFREGLQWIPTYRVELSSEAPAEGPRTARVTLQAELINDIEDLTDVPVDIVVGVPNIRFRNYRSPLTLENLMTRAVRQGYGQQYGQTFANSQISNAIFTQQRAARPSPRRPQPESPGGVDLPDELSGKGNHELYVYSLPAQTIARGRRSAIRIFTATVPVEDVYTWQARVKRTDHALPFSKDCAPQVLSGDTIWHRLELTNTTKMPWTTGAALILEDGRPLGQDLLTYTAPGTAVRVPVTVAVGVQGRFEETESDRQLKALRWDRHDFAKIVKEGRLQIHNHKDRAIRLEVELQLGGKVTRVSNDGAWKLGAYDASDWNQPHRLLAVNNSSSVRWTLEIAAGKSLTPTVVYEYFLRH